jgi:hypothetical protein
VQGSKTGSSSAVQETFHILTMHTLKDSRTVRLIVRNAELIMNRLANSGYSRNFHYPPAAKSGQSIEMICSCDHFTFQSTLSEPGIKQWMTELSGVSKTVTHKQNGNDHLCQDASPSEPSWHFANGT